jgi:hypothetical protein
MADKIPISDIKVGPRFRIESSNQIPRINYERKGGEILVCLLANYGQAASMFTNTAVDLRI